MPTAKTFEEVAGYVQTALRNSSVLSYVDDRNIVITQSKEQIPTFKDYLIKIMTPDSGFMSRQPRIGKYFRITYSVAIELWIKTSLSVANRLISGVVGTNKGIWEFLNDVNSILEHNTFNNQLDPFPGSSIGDATPLEDKDKLLVGVVFFLYANQDADS